jgi:hypothetical protein
MIRLLQSHFVVQNCRHVANIMKERYYMLVYFLKNLLFKFRFGHDLVFGKSLIFNRNNVNTILLPCMLKSFMNYDNKFRPFMLTVLRSFTYKTCKEI